MTTKPKIAPPAAIAVIGLGNMGVPMGACLVRAGFQVLGFDLSREACDRFVEAGGKAAASLTDAVRGADVVITLLPDGKAVRAAADAVRPHLKPGAVFVDMSSSAPMGTRALGEELIAAGFEFVDAPVSGGVRRAKDGTLAIMVGGDAATIDRIEPVLNAMGRSIFRTGPLGSGHAMKALNNYVSAAGLAAAVEAVAIGRAFGLDPNQMTDILNASTGKNNSTEVKLKQFILSESYASGFPLRLMAKDVRTADELAHELGLPSPFADATAELWDAAAASLDAKADHTAIGLHIARLKG